MQNTFEKTQQNRPTGGEQTTTIISDLSLWIVFTDDQKRTYYGQELRNTPRQIKYRNQEPILDYEYALVKLENLVEQKIALGQVKKAVIYLTSWKHRAKNLDGLKLKEWSREGVVFDKSFNFADPANVAYIDSRAKMLKRQIMGCTILINGFNRMERMVLR